MPPGLRVKSQWFRGEAPKSAEQQASAMAFIVWRAAQHMLKRMRAAGFDIDPGEPYFDFMREVMVFLIAVADRIAHARLEAPVRAAFTRELVLHCAGTLNDNAADLLPPRRDGVTHGDAFIDQVNELSGHYAEFGAAPGGESAAAAFTPDFNFVRYLGSRLTATMPPKDARWVLDQVMEIEAPEAVKIVQSAFDNLLSARPRGARRTTMSGD
jgi:hypothetical protein